MPNLILHVADGAMPGTDKPGRTAQDVPIDFKLGVQG